MPADPNALKLFVGLVSFRRNGDLLNILPERAEGASGWQAGRAKNEDQFVLFVQTSLSEIGLEVIEVNDIQELASPEEASELDEHLGDNIRNWEPGKMTVWGTIHIYIGDGEA